VAVRAHHDIAGSRFTGLLKDVRDRCPGSLQHFDIKSAGMKALPMAFQIFAGGLLINGDNLLHAGQNSAVFTGDDGRLDHVVEDKLTIDSFGQIYRCLKNAIADG